MKGRSCEVVKLILFLPENSNLLSDQSKAIPGGTEHVDRIRGSSATAEKTRQTKNKFFDNQNP